MWQTAWPETLRRLGFGHRPVEPILRSLLQWVFPEDLRALPSPTAQRRIEAERRTLGSPERLRRLLQSHPLPVHSEIMAQLLQPLEVEESLQQRVQWSFSQDQIELWRSTGLTYHEPPFDAQAIALALQQLDDRASCCLGSHGSLHARLLLATGRAPSLEVVVQRILLLQQQARDLKPFLRPKDRIRQAEQCWWQFLERVAEPLETAAADKIREAFFALGKGRRVVARALLSLSRTDLADLGHTKLQRVLQRSQWHREVVDALLRDLDAQSQSTFPEERRRSQLGLFVQFLTRLEAHVGDARAFLLRATGPELREALLATLRQIRVRAAWVRSSHHTHHARRHAVAALSFLQGVLRPHCEAQLPTVRELLRHVPNLRVPLPEGTRRTFTDSEMDRMHRATRDPTEVLLLILLREVGLRYSALVHLRYSMLLDHNHKPRTEARVPEKGQRVRAFLCSANLQRQAKIVSDNLRRNVPAAHLPDAYLLNAQAPVKPCRNLRAKLQRIAREAGIRGVHVHPHAFRHTLVGKLMAVGNTLETVSKFMGHRSSRTTSHFYYVPTPEELGKTLIDPFAPREEEEETKLQIYRRLMPVVLKCCDRAALHALLPDFEDVLAAISS